MATTTTLLTGIATATQVHRTRQALTPAQALRTAWVCWLSLMVIPFMVLLYAVWTMMIVDWNAGTPNQQLGEAWFIAAIAYMVLVVPAAIFARSWLFKSYWGGECVSPRHYLAGMLTVWGTIELGGLFSLVGCIVSHSMLPNILPALVAFMVFTALWPSGRAMVCAHRGDKDDPERYEEPR